MERRERVGSGGGWELGEREVLGGAGSDDDGVCSDGGQ